MRREVLKRKNLHNPQIEAYVKALKKGQKSQHVLKVSDGWAVKRANASKASRVFEVKSDAIDYGKKVAKNNHADLFIHDKSGRIQKNYSY